MFFSIFALILTKALPKGCFTLFLPLFYPKPSHKGCFLYFYPYCNQSPTKMVFYSTCIFALTLTKALPQRVFVFICALILTIALTQRVVYSIFCPYSNQSPIKSAVFSIFVLILTRAYQKGCFFLFLPLF